MVRGLYYSPDKVIILKKFTNTIQEFAHLFRDNGFKINELNSSLPMQNILDIYKILSFASIIRHYIRSIVEFHLYTYHMLDINHTKLPKRPSNKCKIKCKIIVKPIFGIVLLSVVKLMHYILVVCSIKINVRKH